MENFWIKKLITIDQTHYPVYRGFWDRDLKRRLSREEWVESEDIRQEEIRAAKRLVLISKIEI